VSVFNKNTRQVLSYDFLLQQKTGVMTKGVVSGGGGFDLHLRRITSSPSVKVLDVHQYFRCLI